MKSASKRKKWKQKHDHKSMLRNKHFKEEKKRCRRENLPRYYPVLVTQKEEDIKYNIINAPNDFSLTNNEEEVLGFIDKIREYYKHSRPVFINMDSVSILGNGAILLLLANMIQFRSHGIPFNGSKPSDIQLRHKLEESGFFKYLYRKVIKRDDYDVGKPKSIIYTHAQKEVNAKMADIIVEQASTTVWGEKRRCPGIHRMLIELMHNTNNHAGRNKGEKHWWISSNKDEAAQTVTISFMDFGRGIFDSLDNKSHGDIFYGCKDAFFSLFPFADTSEKIMKLRNRV